MTGKRKLTEEERKAALEAKVKELVDAAPPLTGEQIAKLRALFSPVAPHTWSRGREV